MGYLNDLGAKCNSTARTKGWLEKERSFGDIVALITSEVSEAYEEHRKGYPQTFIYYEDSSPAKPEGIPIELADALIRIVEWCADQDIDLDEAVRIKMAFNETRSYRHGGKLC